MASMVVVAIALGGIAYWLIQRNSGEVSKVSSQPKVAEKVDYTGQTIPMADISVKVEGGKISIPLDVVTQKRMVRFEYEGKRGQDSYRILRYPGWQNRHSSQYV